MLLDIRAIRETPGAVLPFSCTLDMSGLDFYGEHPLQTPVNVRGEVKNRAAAFEFTAVAEFEVRTACARCARPLTIPKRLDIFQLFAEHLQNEDEDGILPLYGGVVDVDEVVEQAVILNMDRVALCRPDCRGLCPGCGADLNTEVCKCPKHVPDDRLAVLGELLREEQK